MKNCCNLASTCTKIVSIASNLSLALTTILLTNCNSNINSAEAQGCVSESIIVYQGPLTKISVECDQSVAFIGEISNDSVDAVQRILNGQIRSKLTLSSGGGVSDAAIRFGNYIRDNNINVHIKDYCTSACANFILLSSRTTIVERGTLIAFHNTYSSMSEVVHGDQNREITTKFDAIAALEKQYYEERNVDLRFLYFAQYFIETNCYLPVYENGRISNINYQSNYVLWVPSSNLISKISPLYSNYSGSSIEEFVLAVNSWVVVANRERVLLSVAEPPSIEHMRSELRKTPRCT